MKTVTTRSTPAQPMLPVPAQRSRQLSIAFETAVLEGLASDQRASAIRTLAVMLLQAAGVPPEDDDGEH